MFICGPLVFATCRCLYAGLLSLLDVYMWSSYFCIQAFICSSLNFACDLSLIFATSRCLYAVLLIFLDVYMRSSYFCNIQAFICSSLNFASDLYEVLLFLLHVDVYMQSS